MALALGLFEEALLREGLLLFEVGLGDVSATSLLGDLEFVGAPLALTLEGGLLANVILLALVSDRRHVALDDHEGVARVEAEDLGEGLGSPLDRLEAGLGHSLGDLSIVLGSLEGAPGHGCRDQEGGGDEDRGRDGVAANQLPGSIGNARRAGQDRLVVEEALEVLG